MKENSINELIAVCDSAILDTHMIFVLKEMYQKKTKKKNYPFNNNSKELDTCMHVSENRLEVPRKWITS